MRRRVALLGCWLAALIGPACGTEDDQAVPPLPRTAVAELEQQLTSVNNRLAVGDGACAEIERDNRPAVRRTLDELPSTVDPELRQELRQSFTRLFELARHHCDQQQDTDTGP